MANRNVIVVGASAGGVEALRTLVSGLPADLPASVLVVLHLPEGGSSALPLILDRSGPLTATHPCNDQPLRHGEILVAPPGHHLLVFDGVARLSRGPTENGHRPAIDALFRTAARWHGRQVIGVILSGTLDDGTAGQIAVAAQGGVTVVQDPDDAVYAGMPRSVLDHVAVDHVVPAAQLGALLGRLVRDRVECDGGASASDLLRRKAAIADPEALALEHGEPGEPGEPGEHGEHGEPGERPGYGVREPRGRPSGLGCPQCGGSLYEIVDGVLVRYRCRVGHAWSPDSLLAEQSQSLESALSLALRTLEDRAALCRRAGAAARDRGHQYTAGRYLVQAVEAQTAALVLRDALGRVRLGDVQEDLSGPGPRKAASPDP